MEAFVRSPEPLSAKGDIAENWRRWKNDFFIYLKINNYAKKSADEQAYLFRQYIGKIGQNAIDKIIFSNLEDRNNINILIEKLNSVFVSPKNELVERYNFFTTYQKKTETLGDFISVLKEKARTCNFGNMTNSLIRDKIITHIKDKNLRKKLFETEELNLSKLVSIYNEYKIMQQGKHETCKKDITKVQDVEKAAATATITTIHKSSTKKYGQNEQSLNTNMKRKCRNCKQNHPFRACPAWGYKCGNCSNHHHYTNCCKFNIVENAERKTNMHKANINTNLLNPNIHPQRQSLLFNYRLGDSMETHTKQFSSDKLKTLPSAPEFPVDNTQLYPNLNNLKDSNEWSWIGNKNIKSNESETTMPISAAVRQDYGTSYSQTTRDTATTTANVISTSMKKSKHDCKIV